MKEKRRDKKGGKMTIKNKKAFELQQFGGWVLAVVILAVMIIGYIIIKQYGESALEFLKNLLSFGR